MKAVYLTDSLSALQAFMSGEPDTTQKKLTENISTHAQTTCGYQHTLVLGEMK